MSMLSAERWAIGIVISAASYFSLYFVNVIPEHPPMSMGVYLPAAMPEYRLMYKASVIVFYPAYKLDANVLRPHVWEGHWYPMSAKSATR